MTEEHDQTNVAWGLEFGGSALRMIRLERRGASFLADSYRQAPLAGRLDGPALSADAIGRQIAAAAAELLGADALTPAGVACCIGDDLVLVRSAGLPLAGHADLEKMVKIQLEAMLPARDDMFVTGWCRQGDASSHHAGRSKDGIEQVLMAGARKDSLGPFLTVMKGLKISPAAVMPSSLAIGAALQRLGPQNRRDEETIACLDISARSTSLVFMCRGQLISGGTLDHGGDQLIGRIAGDLAVAPSEAQELLIGLLAPRQEPDAQAAAQRAKAAQSLQQSLLQWSRQLRELYQSCSASLPGNAKPGKCLLFGRLAGLSGIAEMVQTALGVTASLPEKPDRLLLGEGVEFSQAAPAIGAALCLLEPRGGVCSLLEQKKVSPAAAPRKALWKWAGAAWLAAAVLAMYGLDVREEARLADEEKTLRGLVTVSDEGSLLALGRYLGQDGEGPVALLDAISSAAPPQAVLTSWNYNRSGEVTLGGTVGSEQELYDFLRKLSESPLLAAKGGAALQSAKNDQNKCRFMVVLKLAGASKPRGPATSQPAAGQPSGAAPPAPASMPRTSSSSASIAPSSGPGASVVPSSGPSSRPSDGSTSAPQRRSTKAEGSSMPAGVVMERGPLPATTPAAQGDAG